MSHRNQGNSGYNRSNSSGRSVVYTDGSCLNNGRAGAQAGIGGYFPGNPNLNFSEPVVGRQTNNTAEIRAAERGIQESKRGGYDRVTVKTDSEFLTKAATQWMPGWKANDWRKADGAPVKNREDFERLDNAMRGMDVRFEHVRGHQGNHGNEQADQLARQGASRRY